MVEQDEISVWLATSILRCDGRDIEALTLEATVEESGPEGLDTALNAAATSEQRGGAFGMEIIGALIIPIVLDAARQLWAAYEKEALEKIGKDAATATTDAIRKWFGSRASENSTSFSERLSATIRSEGAARGLKQADIDALVQAVSPDRLAVALKVDS